MKKIIKIIGALLIVGAGAGGYYVYSNMERPFVIKEFGVYDEIATYKLAEIKSSNVTFNNKVIEDSLVIASDGSHDLHLGNIDVAGDIIVRPPNEEYTIYLDDVKARKLKIDSEYPIVIEMSGWTSIKDIETNQDIQLNGVNLASDASIRNLTINDKNDAQVILKNIGLEMMIVNSSANVILDKSSMVDNLIANAATTLVNEGDIGLLSANADVSYLKEPSNVAIGNNAMVRDSNQVITTTKPATTTKVTTTTTDNRSTTKTTTVKTTARTTAKTTTKTTTKTSTTTTKPTNTAPIIVAEDMDLMVGAKFTALQGVTVTDAEDGRGKLTDSNIVSNNLDLTQAGTYQIVYRFTDKGGLSATHTRTITVSQDDKKMVAPKNLRWSYDNEGALVFAWDYVVGAYDYNVYVNGTQVESGVRRNYAYVEKYMSSSKPNQLSVVAYASPASALLPSVPAVISYTVEPGYVTLSDKVYADTTRSTSIFFHFFDLMVNSRPINPVVVTLERYENRVYVPMANVKLTYNKYTNQDGQVTMTDYARTGGYLDAIFTKQGSYRLTFALKDGTSTTQTIERKFDVVNYDGSLDVSAIDPEVSDFYVVVKDAATYARIDWDAYLLFSLPNELNTSYSDNDIGVAFYYAPSSGSAVLIQELTAYDLRLNRKVIAANEQIRVILSKGDDDAFDDYVAENFEKSVNIYAEITVTEGNREYITKTRTIRLF